MEVPQEGHVGEVRGLGVAELLLDGVDELRDAGLEAEEVVEERARRGRVAVGERGGGAVPRGAAPGEGLAELVGEVLEGDEGAHEGPGDVDLGAEDEGLARVGVELEDRLLALPAWAAQG